MSIKLWTWHGNKNVTKLSLKMLTNYADKSLRSINLIFTTG